MWLQTQSFDSGNNSNKYKKLLWLNEQTFKKAGEETREGSGGGRRGCHFRWRPLAWFVLTEALRLSGEVSAVKVPQPSRLTLISEALPGRGAPAVGKRAAEEGERPHPTKNKWFLVIDTDSSGLIGPDESQGLGGGSARRDLWLASCCQPKQRVQLNASYQNPNTHTHHLSTSPPFLLLLLHLLCLTPPSSATPPAATQAIYTNTHIYIAPKCQRSPRSKWNKWELPECSTFHVPRKRHVRHCVFATSSRLRSFIAHVSSCQSFSQSRLHYSDCNIEARGGELAGWWGAKGAGLF